MQTKYTYSIILTNRASSSTSSNNIYVYIDYLFASTLYGCSRVHINNNDYY